MLQKNKYVIITVCVIYFIGVIIGLFFSDLISVSTNKQEITYSSVVLNNLKSVLFLSIGFFTFGTLTFFILFANGLFLGIVLSSALTKGIPVINVCISILTHGVLEIPGLLLAGVVGLKSAEWLVLKIVGQKTEELAKDVFIFLFISVILIIVAGMVEVNLTPVLRG